MHAFVNVFDCNSKKQGSYIVAATLVCRIEAMEFVVCNVFVCSSCRASPPTMQTNLIFIYSHSYSQHNDSETETEHEHCYSLFLGNSRRNISSSRCCSISSNGSSREQTLTCTSRICCSMKHNNSNN